MELMKSLNFAEVYDMLGGITDWVAAGYPVVVPTTPPTTTTPTINSPVPTNSVPAACLVLGLILPPQPRTEDPFTIIVIVTNTGSSQVSCNIPIIITDINYPTIVVTYKISVTLDAGETKEVPCDEVLLLEGDYMVEVGGISQEFIVY